MRIDTLNRLDDGRRALTCRPAIFRHSPLYHEEERTPLYRL